MKVAAVVLAAGGSSRFCEPKQLLEIDGRSLVRRAAEAARDGGCASVFVVLGAYAERIRPEIDESTFRVVLNTAWSEGLASSIQAGIAVVEADPTCDAVLLMACDQPQIDAGIVRRILDGFCGSTRAIVACDYAGTLGVPALLGRDYFGELAALRGDRGAKAVLRGHEQRLTRVSWPEGAADIDTPDDWAHRT